MDKLTFKDGKHLSHAYIVSSPSESDRLAAAYELARAMVCSSGGTVPCGKCRDCRKAAENIHPDVITVERQLDTHGNPRREIYVDQIRAVAADACVLPNEAARKVYIIRDADTMNSSAQNAALKLLEEPPAWAAFILCAANPAMLLPTVRSRCARLSLNGEEAEPEDGAGERARGFISAAAGGDRIKLLTWCLKNEDMDTAAASEFTLRAVELLTDMLCLRSPCQGMDRARMMGLIKLLEDCGERLKVNTGVKHIMGLLAVDAAAPEK